MDILRSKILPSRTLTISIIAALFIAGFGYYNYGNWRAHFGQAKDTLAENGPKVLVTKEADSDDDGLPDWIELAYGSNPYKKDSDGDGTNDGDEVRMGRDPSKKGPNDFFLAPKNDTASSTASSTSRSTQINQFMSAELAKVQSTTVRDLVNQVDVTQLRPRYSIASLSITSDNSTTSLRAYANAFGALAQKYGSKEMPSEMDIIQTALKSKMQSDIERLNLPAALYQNFTAELLKIKIPSILAEDHLIIVNSYDVMGRSLSMMTKLFSNTVSGAAGWQTYFLNTIAITRGYTGIISKLHEKGITFDRGEPGYSLRWVPSATSTPKK